MEQALTPFYLKVLSYQGDNNVKQCIIEIKRYQNDIDYGKLDFNLDMKKPNDTIYTFPLTKTIEEDMVQLIWKIDKYATDISGNASIQLRGYNSDKTLVAHSDTTPVTIKGSIDCEQYSTNLPVIEIERISLEVQEGLKNCNQYLKEAKALLNSIEIDVSEKVDKISGKNLSTNDFTDTLKTKLDSLQNYNDSAVLASLDTKVDKIVGKNLSTNDYTTTEKTKLATLSNYDDSNILEILDTKVNKISGKSLSSNDFTTEEKNKLSNISDTINQDVVDSLLSSKTYTDTKISALVGSSPESLDTLYEIAEAIEDNQDILGTLNSAIGTKVSKIDGKGLSTNDYTTTEKTKLASLENFDDSDITETLANKVDKITGKSLSTNDYTTEEKTKLASLTNFDDSDILAELATKVDKIIGKSLSTNDYTTEEKAKLASLTNFNDDDILESLTNKVDKVTGKELSTNDFSNAYLALLQKLSNPNELINPNFKINQRGATVYSTESTYTVDRWKLTNGTVTVTDDGITLNGTILQILENSIGTSFTTSSSAGTANYDDDTKTFTLTATGQTITWVKLEKGTISTPFVTPDPTLELLKCQRYYKSFVGYTTLGVAVRTEESKFRLNLQTPVRMRVAPTLVASGNIGYVNCFNVPGHAFTIENLQISDSYNGNEITIFFTYAGITKDVITLVMYAQSSMALDAEI